MKLTEFLMEHSEVHNGHFQNSFKMTWKQVRSIVSLLEEDYPNCYFRISLWSDDTGSVEQVDYWESGEHPLGHRDRSIFSFECIEHKVDSEESQ